MKLVLFSVIMIITLDEVSAICRKVSSRKNSQKGMRIKEDKYTTRLNTDDPFSEVNRRFESQDESPHHRNVFPLRENHARDVSSPRKRRLRSSSSSSSQDEAKRVHKRKGKHTVLHFRSPKQLQEYFYSEAANAKHILGRGPAFYSPADRMSDEQSPHGEHQSDVEYAPEMSFPGRDRESKKDESKRHKNKDECFGKCAKSRGKSEKRSGSGKDKKTHAKEEKRTSSHGKDSKSHKKSDKYVKVMSNEKVKHEETTREKHKEEDEDEDEADNDNSSKDELEKELPSDDETQPEEKSLPFSDQFSENESHYLPYEYRFVTDDRMGQSYVNGTNPLAWKYPPPPRYPYRREWPDLDWIRPQVRPIRFPYPDVYAARRRRLRYPAPGPAKYILEPYPDPPRFPIRQRYPQPDDLPISYQWFGPSRLAYPYEKRPEKYAPVEARDELRKLKQVIHELDSLTEDATSGSGMKPERNETLEDVKDKIDNVIIPILTRISKDLNGAVAATKEIAAAAAAAAAAKTEPAEERPREREKEVDSKKDFPCKIDGLWTAASDSLQLNITTMPNLTVRVMIMSENSKSGCTITKDWAINGLTLGTFGGPFMFAAIYPEKKKVANFIGQCRSCREEDMIFGLWTISSFGRDCAEMFTTVETKIEVFRREGGGQGKSARSPRSFTDT